MSSRSGSKACRWAGPNGETCLESRDGSKPASVKKCPSCSTRLLCRGHCGCKPTGVNAPRGASSVGARPSARAAPMEQMQAQQQPQQPRSRSRSRAAREGRRDKRGRIEESLRGQWRFTPEEERPLPPAGRADSGLVPGRVWRDAVRAPQTLELLASPALSYRTVADIPIAGLQKSYKYTSNVIQKPLIFCLLLRSSMAAKPPCVVSASHPVSSLG
jgi:hypothetical protein